MNDKKFQQLSKRLAAEDATGVRVVEISGAEIEDLTAEQAHELIALHAGNALVELPDKETQFFEWLRVADAPIWEDLWGGDEHPYTVGLGLLAELLPHARGFLICDLVDNQNVYFSANQIDAENGSPVLDAALEIVKSDGKLEMYQAFLVEVWRAPIDQWRFAWMYGQKLDTVKEMIAWMVSESILQLPMREGEQADNADQRDATAYPGAGQ